MDIAYVVSYHNFHHSQHPISKWQVVEKFLTEELGGETSSSGSNSPLTPLAAPTAFECARIHSNTNIQITKDL